MDDALGFIQTAGSEPWFLWLGFSAPHSPAHAPPVALQTQTLPADPTHAPALAIRAAMQALDTEIGRLSAGIPADVLARTVVVFLGDNGTWAGASLAPWAAAHAKGTVYEGGLRVPLILSGPGIATNAQVDWPVSGTDLFATLAELAGHPAPSGLDSISLVPALQDPSTPPLRQSMITEWFRPNGSGPSFKRLRAARDDRHKLVRSYNHELLPQATELYDLSVDPLESSNLLASPLDPAGESSIENLALLLDQLDDSAPWQDLGHGLAGAVGLPDLVATGALQGGEMVSLLAGDLPASTGGLLVLGLNWLGFPFKGGVVVPTPDLILPGVTDTLGFLYVRALWPLGVPGGLGIYVQIWAYDVGGPAGLSATSGVTALTR